MVPSSARLAWIVIGLTGATGGAGTLPVDTAADAELLAIAGEGFTIHRTDHFVIAHNTSPEILKAFVTRAERTFDGVLRFCRTGGIPVTEPGHRLQMLFFDTPEGFVRYGRSIGFDQEGASGVYSPSHNRSAFFNTLNTPQLAELTRYVEDMENRLAVRPGGAELPAADRIAVQKHLQSVRSQRDRFVTRVNQLVVQHEMAHQVLYNIGVHTVGAQNPGWLLEGLACLFETPPTRSGAGFGAMNQMRLRDFRACLTLADDNGPRMENLDRACRSGRLLPLKDLIADADLFSQGDNPQIVYVYAETWSLVHYMQRRHREKLAEYVRQVALRRPGQKFTAEQEIAAFEAVFGPIDEPLERRWLTFTLDLPYRPEEAGG